MERWKSKKNQKYSPAIRSELIERLSRERKRRRVPMTKWLHGTVEKALPEWEAEVLPEVQGAGENGVRTMAPEKQGTKQVGPPAANAGKFTVATLAGN
jgi:hypothetical protein